MKSMTEAYTFVKGMPVETVASLLYQQSCEVKRAWEAVKYLQSRYDSKHALWTSKNSKLRRKLESLKESSS